MSNVALIVIYNHRYDRNIEIVEKIYADRFSVIFHLVPFYTGDRPNVIPVYENSYYFQGYVAQGFRHFKGDYRHYFFIADDMVLNPAIDEHNYAALFGLDDASGFLPELDSMPAPRWPHNRAAITFDPYRRGVEIRNEIPSPEVARAVIEALKVRNGSYPFKDTYFFDHDYSLRNVVRQVVRYAYDKVVLRTRHASKYPFVRSYSDLFIVSAVNAPRFVHLCGAFAATDLWVELAIPTALVLSGEKIKVQADLTLQGRPLWSADDLALLDTFDYKLRNLLDHFPPVTSTCIRSSCRNGTWPCEESVASGERQRTRDRYPHHAALRVHRGGTHRWYRQAPARPQRARRRGGSAARVDYRPRAET